MLKEFDKWLKKDGVKWFKFVRDVVEDKEGVLFRGFVWCDYFNGVKK